MALSSAAVSTLGGDIDEDFPLGAQIREVIERDMAKPDQDRLGQREKLLNPKYIATVKAPVSAMNPDGDDSSFDLVRRILRQIDDGEGQIH